MPDLRWRRCAAVDVHYPATGGAGAAMVVAPDARFAEPLGEHVTWLDEVAAYQPGRFFARELPAIRAVLAAADPDAGHPFDLLVVDGYVDLDPDGRPGLGWHVHDALGVAVIGVAKTAFRSATHAVAVRRGGSLRPLYVTAAGLPVGEAATVVAEMAGTHRIPTALRRVDRLARSGVPAP